MIRTMSAILNSVGISDISRILYRLKVGFPYVPKGIPFVTVRESVSFYVQKVLSQNS